MAHGFETRMTDSSGLMHRLKTSIIAREQIEVSMMEEIKDDAAAITRKYAQARIGHRTGLRPARPSSGDLVRSIKGKFIKPGSSQLYTDDSEYRNGFNYAAVFEYGMRKFPQYRGRHFWRDAKHEVQARYLAIARVKLRTIKKFYEEGE